MALKANKLFLPALLLSSVFSPLAQAATVETNTARMQAMDKITGRVSEIDVPVNSPVKFGSFSILVRKCVTRTPEETPENTAFVDVIDDYDRENPVNIFKGWMFSSSPALSAVEHPIYDVWLLKCYDKDNKGVVYLDEEALQARDEIEMVRSDKPKVSPSAEESPSPMQQSDEAAKSSEFDEMIKATIAAEDQMSEPAAEEKTVEIVVTPAEEADEDAPQAVFAIKEQPTAVDGAANASDEAKKEIEAAQPSSERDENVMENTFIDEENAFAADEENAFAEEE